MNENARAWLIVASAALAGCRSGPPPRSIDGVPESMKIQFIRNATVTVTYENADGKKVKLLVDPILAEEGTEPPIDHANAMKNPTIRLPMHEEQLMAGVDAVLLTHDHPDHFDGEAARTLPKNILIFCQPYDEKQLREKGFSNLRVVGDVAHWNGLTISRFLASHHRGATGAPPFGESSSFFLQTKNAGLFFTGDAILDERLRTSLITARPRTIVANTGECQFTKENTILAPGITMTLTAAELEEIARILPESKIVAVHMDAINHCPLTKYELRMYVEHEKLKEHIVVPSEGDVIFTAPGR